MTNLCTLNSFLRVRGTRVYHWSGSGTGKEDKSVKLSWGHGVGANLKKKLPPDHVCDYN